MHSLLGLKGHDLLYSVWISTRLIDHHLPVFVIHTDFVSIAFTAAPELLALENEAWISASTKLLGHDLLDVETDNKKPDIVK